MVGAPRWLRARMGVRAASALSAALVVAVSLVIAGAALVFLVGQSLRGTVDAAAAERTQQLVERIEQNFRGAANENAREAQGSLTTDTDLLQVLVEYVPDDGDSGDSSTVIEAYTPAVGNAAPISDVRPAEDQTVTVDRARIPLADGGSVEAVLVASAGESAGREFTVLSAIPLTSVNAATDTILFYLFFGVPILIVVAGLTTYLFAGRALRPVEAIRRQVAAMTEKDLEQRVPVPAARDEVGRLAETMNAMIARLEDAQGVQRRFVADASHELRSPLATIAAGLELLQRDTSDPATVTALRMEAERLNRLVDALLLLARADERGLQPRREEVDLDEVAEAERGRPTEGGARAEVRAEPVRVIGDRGQLVRVLRNLVDNALRHARSRVLVTVVREGDSALVEVSDDGPGVPAADRARVFERFVRLDDARARADGGSGLGLAIVAEVVAAHGGRVEVGESAEGGALFRVWLPTAPEHDERPGRAPAAPAPVPVPAPVPAGSGSGASEPPTLPPTVPAAAPGVERPRPSLPSPLRDADARRDPATAPWGIPGVGGGQETRGDQTVTDPRGTPVVPPVPAAPAPAAPAPVSRAPGDRPVRTGPSGQPGSTIR